MSDNGHNGRATFAIYALTAPGGNVTGDLTPALRRALAAYQERHGCPPLGLVVNEALIGQAREALGSLGLPRLQVTSSGGCLAWEVWLEVIDDGDGHRPAFLLRRVEEAQGGMTPARARQLALELEEVTR